MLDLLVYFLGYCVLGAIATFLFFLCLSFGFKKDSHVLFTIFGFGLIYTYDNSEAKKILNLINKSENKNWFITAPKWFNKHVWNIGGAK